GMGALALGDLLAERGLLGQAARAADASSGATPSRSSLSSIGAINPLAPRASPLRARAKRVVHLFMNGGPSHVDTFDPKPMLDKFAGKPLPTPNLPTERKTGAAFPS